MMPSEKLVEFILTAGREPYVKLVILFVVVGSPKDDSLAKAVEIRSSPTSTLSSESWNTSFHEFHDTQGCWQSMKQLRTC